MMRYSTTYVTTIDFMSTSDMEKLQAIRASVRVLNSLTKNSKFRVCLRGRNPILKVNKSYDRGGNIVGGINNAQRADVYIYPRR
jgi:hypothetical protein